MELAVIMQIIMAIGLALDQLKEEDASPEEFQEARDELGKHKSKMEDLVAKAKARLAAERARNNVDENPN